MRYLKALAGRSSLAFIYQEAGLGASIRRSLNLMLLANLFGNLFGVICGGSTAAMIGLANQLKAGDLAFGVINGIPQAAALLQLPFSVLVSRTHRRKKYLMTFGLFSRFLWMLFGLVPLVLPANPEWLPLWTVIFLLGISSCCAAAINVCWFPWFSDLAPFSIRGRWFSYRDTLVAITSLLFGLLTARLLDTLPPDTRYLIIFVIGGILGMSDMICFAFCEEKYSAPPVKLKIASAFRDVLKRKNFRRLVIMWLAWCFTANLCEPYLGRYSVNEMGLNFTQLMTFGTVAASIATILVMKRWGRALDRYGCRSVMMIAVIGASLTNGFYLFSSPGSVMPVLLRNFLGAAFWSGSNLAANSMQLSASPDEARPMYIAVFSCVTALLGTTLGSLVGGALLELWEAQGWFSGSFDRYKALITLSVILRFTLALVLVPRLENDRDGTPKELLLAAVKALKPRKVSLRRKGNCC